jgi:hypothetical protein
MRSYPTGLFVDALTVVGVALALFGAAVVVGYLIGGALH